MADVNVFYRAKRAAHLGNAVAETMFTRADAVALGQAVQTFLSASGKLDGQGMSVIARGNIIVGANGNLTINIRQGNSVAGTLMATTGAVALTTGNYSFELRFEGTWDANSQTLRGRVSGWVGANNLAHAAVSAPITGFNPAGSVDMPFIASALFSVSNAGNDIWLTEFVSATD